MTEELLANAYIKGASDLLQGKIEGMPKIIVIPQDATNGDMFVAVFKPYKVIVHSAQVQVYLTEQKWQMFGISWWNAPFKGSEGE